MDYGNYREVPEYYHPAMDPLHAPPPIHYAPYPHPPMPPIKLEPIVPHDNDILMGRGGKNNQHVGNEAFRKLARVDAKAYSTSSKKIKSNIARGLVAQIRRMQPAGRFLKRNPVTSEWEDVGDEYAREKASQVLRDAVALLPEASDSDIGEKKRAEAEEAPELSSEPHDIKPPAPKRARVMSRASAPPAYFSSYATTSPGWHYQTPMTPTPAPPILKRLRSSNWFERAAFFTSENPQSMPNLSNYGKSDSSRSLGAILASPTLSLSRQGSLCASLAGDLPVLPGENFLLTSNNHERQEPVDSPDLSQDGASDEFLSEFF